MCVAAAARVPGPTLVWAAGASLVERASSGRNLPRSEATAPGGNPPTTAASWITTSHTDRFVAILEELKVSPPDLDLSGRDSRRRAGSRR